MPCGSVERVENRTSFHTSLNSRAAPLKPLLEVELWKGIDDDPRIHTLYYYCLIYNIMEM